MEKMLDAYKELTPVVYGDNGIKHLALQAEPNRISFSMHWHNRMELLYITSGHLKLYLGQEHFSAFPGQVVVIMPCMMHYGIAGDEGVSFHTIMFDLEDFCNATGASEKYLLPICKYKTGFHAVTDQPELTEAFERLLEILTEDTESNPLITVGIVYEIIGILQQSCSTRSNMLHRVDQDFGKVLEYINEHFMEKISAKDISAKFGYNEAYFCRRFKAVSGITAMKYIQILRLEQAQKLLKSTDEEIGDIAWKCGFGDISYFSNCFKKYAGHSPTEFRKIKG